MMVFRGGAFGRYWGSDDGICCCCLVTKSCPALWDSMDCSPPGSSVHGISQVRILECIAISFSKGSSWPGDQTRLSCTGRRILYHWATRKPHDPLQRELSSALSLLPTIWGCREKVADCKPGREPSLEPNHCWHLDLRLSAPTPVRKENSVV